MWVQFVQDFRRDNPNVSWKNAMKRCKPLYEAHKKRTHTQCRHRGVPHDPEKHSVKLCKPVKLSKKQRQKIKDECSILGIRKPADRKIFQKK